MQLNDLVLINPPCPDLTNPVAQMPLGLLYLAAQAERFGHDVTICNLAGGGASPEAWRIPLGKVYGITGTCLHIEMVNALAREVKRRNHSARVIVGGPISLSKEELDFAHIDTLVHGEGESVIDALIRAPGPREITGVASALDDLPDPARHLWSGPFGGSIFIGGQSYYGGGSATILTTRGCPHSCAFCAGPALCPREVRFLSPDRVIGEMESLARNYGVRQFRLSDEFFTAKRSHVSGVCEGIRQSAILGHGKTIAWRASVAVRPNDRSLWEMMAEAGCKEVSFGVESADPDVLNLIARKGGPDDARDALLNARAAGLKTRALMMVGLPGETQKTPELNIAFIRSGLFTACAVTVFSPLPGCDIRNSPEKYGCELIPERIGRSICMYGPDGRNAILPTIRMAHIPEMTHALGMRATVEAAEALHVIGHGEL